MVSLAINIVAFVIVVSAAITLGYILLVIILPVITAIIELFENEKNN